MLDFLIMIMAFIGGLGVLITFHELGHFLVARAFGVKIICFSIGFGKTLIRHVAQNGTEYRIAALPLGGYVKMLGERDEQGKSPSSPSALNQKSVWVKMSIVLAGPLFNFIFAFFAYVFMFMIGIQGVAPLVGSIAPNSIADKAGMLAPVEIITIDNKPTSTWQQVLNEIVPKIGDRKDVLTVTAKPLDASFIQTYRLPLSEWQLDGKIPDLIGSLGWEPLKLESPAIIRSIISGETAEKSGLLPEDRITHVANKPILNARALVDEIAKRPNIPTTVTIMRKNAPIDIILTPKSKALKNGQLSGHIGITLEPIEVPKTWIRTQQYSFIKSLKPAYHQTVYSIQVSLKLMAKMVTGKLSPSTLSGPVGIAKGAGSTFKNGFQYYLGFLALISISLGVVNLLPIPILDGGHIFYYIIEIITRRPVPQRVQDKASVIGLFFILILMSVSFYNDIIRLF